MTNSSRFGNILWIDDVRNPDWHHPVVQASGISESGFLSRPIVVCRTVEAAISLLDRSRGFEPFSFVFLDHDLGVDSRGCPADTMQILRAVQQKFEYGFPTSQSTFYLSMNPIGVSNMKAFIESWEKSFFEG